MGGRSVQGARCARPRSLVQAPGAGGGVGAPGAPGTLDAAGAPGASTTGTCKAAPQPRHFAAPVGTSAPHFGQFFGPSTATGGLKHMAYPFLWVGATGQGGLYLKRIRRGEAGVMTFTRPNARVRSAGQVRG